MTLASRPARIVAAGALMIGVVSCVARIPPPPAAAPSLDRPSAAIPADLDVAFRVDLDAAKRFFGPSVARALRVNLVDPATDPAMAAFLADALARTSTVWVALRPGLAADAADNVLILRGAFGQLEPGADSGFEPPVDLGAAFRRYDRPVPKRRSAPARVYARANDWLVFVSSAELDSTARSLDRGSSDPHLDPPDRGLFSLSARVPPLVPLLLPGYRPLAEALAGATMLDASVLADDRGLRVNVDVRFETGGAAVEARDRARLLLAVLGRATGLVGKLARGAVADAEATTLFVKIELDARGLSEVIGCLTGASCE